MKVTLIRHTSVAVPPGICYGQSDVSLAETFQSEASLVSEKIKDFSFDAVYSSPMVRCLRLAEFCGFQNPNVDKRLLEINFGDWEMQAWDNIHDPKLQNWFNNWVNEIPGKGESFRQMIARVSDFSNELKGKNHQHVAIFTHAGVIRSFSIIQEMLRVEKAFDFNVQYGAIIEIEM